MKQRYIVHGLSRRLKQKMFSNAERLAVALLATAITGLIRPVDGKLSVMFLDGCLSTL